MLPDQYVQTMKVLHHEAPQMPLEDIYQVLEAELGRLNLHIYRCIQFTENHSNIICPPQNDESVRNFSKKYKDGVNVKVFPPTPLKIEIHF